MNRETLLETIRQSLNDFHFGTFESKATALFGTLGYSSERKLPGLVLTKDNISEHFMPAHPLNKKNALAADWDSVRILFQLTEDDLQTGQQLKMQLDTSKGVNPAVYQSYLFMGIELNKDKYTRGQLTNAVREINRLFMMPVMVLFKHGNALTLGIIHRRPSKKDTSKDVLEKVTLIKDIQIDNPNRAHLEILADLSVNEIAQTKPFSDLLELHERWKEILNVSELNKRFYGELFNWYCWATRNVVFPDGHFKDSETRNAVNVIRLITRLIFVWFVKEKGLIPKELFDPKWLRESITPAHDGHSTYYKAVLQNLFFATLNTEMGAGRHYDTGADDPCCYHFESLFKDPLKVLSLFAGIPFLNGGLFESLDRPNEGVWVDGFTSDPSCPLQVPDNLFFEEGIFVDLSQEYGVKGHDREKVRGLIRILNGYKFTIEENTPLDEEVALDPELLGKVFENLLAAYNHETGITARKQTGSFYTPREIVDYMVDESLASYFISKLQTDEALNETNEEVLNKVHDLLSYSPFPHKFNEDEVNTLIGAVDSIKVLDPAVGSGAFPMVVLHKLVHVLSKLDKGNQKWEERQIYNAMAINDIAIRNNAISDIKKAFTENALDYGRKLFLIRKCLFGVDIQPVAVQIAKLRFFISLIVDQVVNPNKPNLGLVPLPNLESKFVVANSLIGIKSGAGENDTLAIEQKKAELAAVQEKLLKPIATPEEKKRLLETAKRLRAEHTNLSSYKIKNPKIAEKEFELAAIRENIFSAHSPSEKTELRRKDKEVREEIFRLLRQENWDDQSAELLSSWDPYDQNKAAGFFDKKWMLGISGGFDIAIGNPPYIKEYTNREAFDGVRESPYYQGKMDLWYLFACKCLDLLNPERGVLAFIATNNWTTNAGASALRNKVVKDSQILQLIDFGEYKIFESADIQTMVMLFKKSQKADEYVFDLRRNTSSNITWDNVSGLLNKKEIKDLSYLTPRFNREKMKDNLFVFSNKDADVILQKIDKARNFTLDDKSEVAQGIVAPQDSVNEKSKAVLGPPSKVGDGIFVISDQELLDLNLEPHERTLIKPYFTTNELGKYHGQPLNNFWVIYTGSEYKYSGHMNPYPNVKRHLDKYSKIITSDNYPYGLHRSRNEYFFVGEKIISLRKCEQPTFTYTDFDCYVSQTFYLIKSERINLKYLTGFLNSKIVSFWLKHKGKMQGNHYQVDKEPLLGVPIHIPEPSVQKLVENLVNRIIAAKRLDDSTNTEPLESEINDIFYRLFKLSSEEIKTIEDDVSAP